MAKVLIVDDTAFMRMMMKSILEENGIEVVAEAKNGIEAVQLFKQVRPDLVTMDITMPEMDGLQALSEIKKMDGNARVIMCSAMGQQSIVIQAIMAGAKDFVVKPFHKDRVREAVRRVMNMGE
jgi:two-component system chemotaxis response regulator CheY